MSQLIPAAHGAPRNRHVFKAFTLIELLVVIAIIAILAAILFPFSRARAKTPGAAVARATSSRSVWP